MRRLAQLMPRAFPGRSVLTAWALIAMAAALAAPNAAALVWALPLVAVVPLLSRALHGVAGGRLERLSAWPRATVLLALAFGLSSAAAALAEAVA